MCIIASENEMYCKAQLNYSEYKGWLAQAAAWISGISSRGLDGPATGDEGVGLPIVESKAMVGGGGGRTVRFLDSSCGQRRTSRKSDESIKCCEIERDSEALCEPQSIFGERGSE